MFGGAALPKGASGLPILLRLPLVMQTLKCCFLFGAMREHVDTAACFACLAGYLFATVVVVSAASNTLSLFVLMIVMLKERDDG